MKKRIFLFSHDPGGANAIFPLFDPLSKKGYEVLLYGKGSALIKYGNVGLCGTDINDFIKNDTYENIKELIERINPDMVITGTSAQDFSEKYIWKACSELNIPSIAILDYWTNYGIRFSKYCLSETDKYNADKQHNYLPDRILVMDEYAFNGIVKEGIDKNKIIISGHPYFNYIKKISSNIDKDKLLLLRKKFGCGEKDILITFASEPISSDYGACSKYRGFNEKSILGELLEALQNIRKYSDKLIKVVIRPHPREKIEEFSEYLDASKELVIDRNTDAWEMIKASDIVCGMSSMFLIESVIFEKPTISILIGLINENPFILDKMGILKSVLDKKELINKILYYIENSSYILPKYKVIEDSIGNVISIMEDMLCRN